ncbi:MAG: alkaline phosphatase PhoX, partial [Burkholderiaceae bacterium]
EYERRNVTQQHSQPRPLGEPDVNGIRLPPGFSSRVVARSGVAPVAGSTLWHSAPDGGACYASPEGGWIYVSNSEMQSRTGGARALRFDASASVVDCYVILSGTSNNCAGGKMPWGAWLSCEENGDLGYVYECDPTGATPAIVRPALGRFSHEAVAWDAVQGRLYLTEDRNDGRLYRFTPTATLASGAPDPFGRSARARSGEQRAGRQSHMAHRTGSGRQSNAGSTSSRWQHAI